MARVTNVNTASNSNMKANFIKTTIELSYLIMFAQFGGVDCSPSPYISQLLRSTLSGSYFGFLGIIISLISR